jgi:hypothetical protein
LSRKKIRRVKMEEIKLRIEDNQVVLDEASLESIIIYIINNILTKLDLVSLVNNNTKAKTKAKSKTKAKPMADLALTSLANTNTSSSLDSTLSPLNLPSPLKAAIGFYSNCIQERFSYKYKITGKDGSVAKNFFQKNTLEYGKSLIEFFFDVIISNNKSLPPSLALALSVYTENQYLYLWNKKKWEWGTENPPLDKKWWL